MLAFLNTYIFFTFLTTLAISDSLVLFFISWVGLNISLYGILLKSFNSYNKEMTLKYFVSGSVITVFLLFSIMLFFMEYFNFNYSTYDYLFFLESENLKNMPCFSITSVKKFAYLSLLFSMFFKLGAFPFHFYLTDIYQTLNEKETMFIYTIVLKLGIFITILKILSNFWYLNYFIFDFLIISGFGSVFVSSFSILKQSKLSKIWSQSYLNSIGFTTLAISSGIINTGGDVSFYSAKVYFYTYLLAWFGLLDFLSRIELHGAGSFGVRKLYYVSDLTYLSKINKFGLKTNLFLNLSISFCFIVLLLSFLGLPPTSGFFSKAILYSDLISNPNTVFVLWASLLTTPFISFAYLRLVIYSIVNLHNSDSSNIAAGVTIKKSKVRDYFVGFEVISTLVLVLPLMFYLFY